MPAKNNRFSYSRLSDEDATKLRAIAAKVSPLLDKLLPTAVEAGRELRKAKALLQHGEFGPFCREVVKLDARMCQHFINL